MVVGVLVEISHKNVDRIFEYNVPDLLTSEIKIGIRVLVPFGRMELEGFVLNISDKKRTDKELGIYWGWKEKNVISFWQ